jgi:succinate-semialdehyde dehydrogenase/glutarate-semialdehyde dehydrogenase
MPDLSYDPPAMFVAGEWITRTPAAIPVENPATGGILGELPQADEAIVERALASAAEGFETWRRTEPAERARIMADAARILRGNLDKAARELTLDQGKPLAEARSELENCALLLEYCPQEAARVEDRVLPGRPGFRDLRVRHEPIGPVVALSPWNFPASLAGRKLASALAVGCSVIVRPAGETPSGITNVVRALDAAGLPKGVVNLLHGAPEFVTGRLIDSPVTRKIVFTGSTRVGCELAARAGRHAKPSVMELGGHAPVLICADADLDQAVELSVTSKYRNAGQVCVSPTRWYVDETHHDAFCRRFAAAADALAVGDGLDPATRMGPMANGRAVDNVDRLVQDAVARGARLLAGGRRIERQGHFYAPTVLADVPADARIMTEEPFGPVAVINRFSDLAGALAAANSTPYALGAYAFTRSEETAETIARAFDAGMIGINTYTITHTDSPIGGRRYSGFGSEGGPEGIAAYLMPKFTAMA